MEEKDREDVWVTGLCVEEQAKRNRAVRDIEAVWAECARRVRIRRSSRRVMWYGKANYDGRGCGEASLPPEQITRPSAEYFTFTLPNPSPTAYVHDLVDQVIALGKMPELIAALKALCVVEPDPNRHLGREPAGMKRWGSW